MQSRLLSVVALVGVLAYAAYGVWTAGMGFATDSDSIRIWTSSGVLLEGRYEPSRTTGFPLYEAMVALLRAAGAGVYGVNLATLALGVAALLLLWRGLPGPAGCIAIGLAALTPVVLVNASALMETNLTILLVVAYVVALLRDQLDAGAPGDPPNPLGPLPLMLGILLVTARLDAAIVVLAAGAARWSERGDRRFLVHVALIGVVTLAIYTGLHGGLGFLAGIASVEDSLARKVVKASVGAFAALWTAGGVAVLLVLAALPQMTAGWRRFLMIVTVLFGLRLLALPDEVEYLMPWLITVLIAAGVHARARAVLLMLPVAAVGHLFSLSAFAKTDPLADGYRLIPGIEAPAWLQEAERRRERIAADDPAFWERLRDLTGLAVAGPILSLEIPTPDGRATAVFRDGVYRYLSPRWDMDTEGLERLVICDRALLQTRGWRQLLQPYPVTVLSSTESLADMACTQVSAPVTRERIRERAEALLGPSQQR